MATSPYVNDFFGLEPLTGPNGVRYASYAQTLPSNRWFITRDCKNPELAFRVGDAMFNEDASIRARYGVQGQDWLPAEPGSLSIYEGYEATHAIKQNIWSVAQNSHWRNNAPIFMYKVIQRVAWNLDPMDYDRRIGLIVAKYQDCIPKEGTYVPLLSFTEEETDRINEIQTTLKTYVQECKIRFITGDMSLDNDWNTYLKEIEKIGLQEFLEVCQTVYDRMSK